MRRELITLLGATAACAVGGRAQQPAMPRFLGRGLGELWGQNNRLPDLAAELVLRRVYMIAALGSTQRHSLHRRPIRRCRLSFWIGANPTMQRLNLATASASGLALVSQVVVRAFPV